MLDGKDVFRHTHSPRSLSKSIVARYATVSYLNTGNGLSGGHVPARMDFISDCCRAEASPAILALLKFMILLEAVTRPCRGRQPVLEAPTPLKEISFSLCEISFGRSCGIGSRLPAERTIKTAFHGCPGRDTPRQMHTSSFL